jgi:phosphatidylserine synthase
MYLPNKFLQAGIALCVGVICLGAIALLIESAIRISHTVTVPEMLMRVLFCVIIGPLFAYFSVATHYRFCKLLPVLSYLVQEAPHRIAYGGGRQQTTYDGTTFVFERNNKYRTDVISVFFYAEGRTSFSALIDKTGVRIWEKGWDSLPDFPEYGLVPSYIAFYVENSRLNNVQMLYRLSEAIQSVEQSVRRE